MNEPLVTVLMPVYNGAAYLKDAIESVLWQTYVDFVFLIVNDGSTDDTENIILSFNDSRIQYVKNAENLKLVNTLNKGLSLVRTKYVARIDADDVSLPDRLERQVSYMEQNPDVGVVGTWCRTFGEGIPAVIKYEVANSDICFRQLYQIQIVHPSCMMRMSVLNQLDLVYDESYLHAEDYELFTRLSHITKLANIPEILHLYRKHDEAVSILYKNQQKENSLRVIKREFSIVGVNISDLQAEDFCRLNYQDYRNIQMSATEMKLFLEHLVLANQSSQIFDESFFLEKLSDLWFSYCYELNSRISMYKSSFLARKLTIFRKLKWLLRRFLKNNPQK